MPPRFACLKDEAALRILWRACFPEDGEEFADYFFTNLFKPENTLLYMEQGKAVSMLHMMPYDIAIYGKTLPVSYIYGVGTDPGRRGGGFARGLIENALTEMRLRGVAAAVLIPQQEWLFDFYKKSGFEPVFFLSKRHIKDSGFKAKARIADLSDIEALNALYEKATVGRAHILRTHGHWTHILKEASLFGGGVYALYSGEELISYAVYSEDGNISEAYPLDESVFVPSGSEETGAAVTVPADGKGDTRRFGCVRVVNTEKCLSALNGRLDACVTLTDSLCPQNSGEYKIGGGRNKLNFSQEELVRFLFLGEGGWEAPPYMNLMHN